MQFRFEPMVSRINRRYLGMVPTKPTFQYKNQFYSLQKYLSKILHAKVIENVEERVVFRKLVNDHDTICIFILKSRTSINLKIW